MLVLQVDYLFEVHYRRMKELQLSQLMKCAMPQWRLHKVFD